MVLISLKRGEKKAYEEIYQSHYGILYHLCLQYLHDEKISEEIVQDSFMKLWEIRETLNEQFNIRNFLYTITKNNCLNYLRNQKTAFKHLENLKYMEMKFNYEALGNLGSYIEFEELQIKIEQAISALPDDLKETFCLSRFEELSYRDIALKQSISIKTVESRITKTLKLLRQELKDYITLICLISNLLS